MSAIVAGGVRSSSGLHYFNGYTYYLAMTLQDILLDSLHTFFTKVIYPEGLMEVSRAHARMNPPNSGVRLDTFSAEFDQLLYSDAGLKGVLDQLARVSSGGQQQHQQQHQASSSAQQGQHHPIPQQPQPQPMQLHPLEVAIEQLSLQQPLLITGILKEIYGVTVNELLLQKHLSPTINDPQLLEVQLKTFLKMCIYFASTAFCKCPDVLDIRCTVSMRGNRQVRVEEILAAAIQRALRALLPLDQLIFTHKTQWITVAATSPSSSNVLPREQQQQQQQHNAAKANLSAPAFSSPIAFSNPTATGLLADLHLAEQEQLRQKLPRKAPNPLEDSILLASQQQQQQQQRYEEQQRLEQQQWQQQQQQQQLKEAEQRELVLKQNQLFENLSNQLQQTQAQREEFKQQWEKERIERDRIHLEQLENQRKELERSYAQRIQQFEKKQQQFVEEQFQRQQQEQQRLEQEQRQREQERQEQQQQQREQQQRQQRQPVSSAFDEVKHSALVRTTLDYSQFQSPTTMMTNQIEGEENKQDTTFSTASGSSGSGATTINTTETGMLSLSEDDPFSFEDFSNEDEINADSANNTNDSHNTNPNKNSCQDYHYQHFHG